MIINQVVLGQTIEGYVIDAYSNDSLAGVHLANKNIAQGTVTNHKGYFHLKAHLNDSIVFSSVGYHNAYFIVNDSSDYDGFLTISMLNDTIVLKEIFVVGLKDNYLQKKSKEPIAVPGVKPLEDPEPVKPMSFDWGVSPEAESDFPVFGPKATLYGPLSYFTAAEKEKRKLAEIQKQEAELAIFDKIVASPETKRLIRNAFQISGEKYERMVGTFRREHKSLISVSKKEEILGLLIQYFSQRSN